ncbi:MAG TPA: hypothetical protein VHE55_04435 [Fimbriimonadaceae bacterium]|nr:hypothetical protein [Fimbriimonadaceae bacterium]
MKKLLSLGLLGVCGVGFAQTRYLSVDLGTLGGNSASALALNDHGDVVGSAYTAAGQPHAFLYSGGVMHDLGTLPGDTISNATGINNLGQVVGVSSHQNGDGSYTYHAFLYADGVMQNLGTLAGFSDSKCGSINDSGVVVGWSIQSAGPQYHAFTYDGGSLRDVSGGLTSIALAINSSGQAAGQVRFSDFGDWHAALFSGGVVQDLGVLPGFSFSQADALNSIGQVVGICQGPGVTDGFLYSAGTMTDLGGLGGLGAWPTGINDAGYVVGSSLVRLSNGHQVNHGFVYVAGHMRDLNSLIFPRRVGPIFSLAYGINSHGLICGQTMIDGNHSHATLLVPYMPISIHP